MIEPRPVVIDASIAVAIARSEPERPRAAAAITRWTRDGARIVVPSHFWLEVTNALIRRHRWDGAAVFEAIRELDEMALETIELDRAILLSSVDFSERHGLSSYDAMYLALTDALDGSLLTLDERLRVAAGPRAASLDGQRLSETPASYERDVAWPNYRGASAYLAKLRAEAGEASVRP